MMDFIIPATNKEIQHLDLAAITLVDIESDKLNIRNMLHRRLLREVCSRRHELIVFRAVALWNPIQSLTDSRQWTRNESIHEVGRVSFFERRVEVLDLVVMEDDIQGLQIGYEMFALSAEDQEGA